ncbi:type 1 glutamine amidotransferase [Virgibacillus halophilus]|uniref:Type 1 glutamine amidotransferase n=1 Tax=Tigheibacillus halophilus TaxID=361280 RepID=A0ABU5C1Y1_9BACI|nr:type 1 glutamine amidotransferase [Virgibacillus halophilus]
MKPLIGITASMEMDESYYMMSEANVKAILQAGGMPLILPYLLDDADVEQIASRVDGLYLPGGYDIDPTLFNEEPHPKLGTIIPDRDRFEMLLVDNVLQQGKPILGVCRGAQILNIALGGRHVPGYIQPVDRIIASTSTKSAVRPWLPFCPRA